MKEVTPDQLSQMVANVAKANMSKPQPASTKIQKVKQPKKQASMTKCRPSEKKDSQPIQQFPEENVDAGDGEVDYRHDPEQTDSRCMQSVQRQID